MSSLKVGAPALNVRGSGTCGVGTHIPLRSAWGGGGGALQEGLAGPNIGHSIISNANEAILAKRISRQQGRDHRSRAERKPSMPD